MPDSMKGGWAPFFRAWRRQRRADVFGGRQSRSRALLLLLALCGICGLTAAAPTGEAGGIDDALADDAAAVDVRLPVPSPGASPSSSLLDDDEENTALQPSADKAAPAAVPAVAGPLSPAMRASAAEGETSTAWSIPPLPWRGRATLTGDRTRSSGAGATTSSFIKTLDGSAKSYIWAPWFATVNASGSLNQIGAGLGRGTTGGEFWGFDTGLGLIPQSRYPLAINFGQSTGKSRIEGRTSELTSRRLSMQQGIAPAQAIYRANWNYSRSEFTGTDIGSTLAQALGGSWSLSLPGDNPQGLNLNGNIDESSNSLSSAVSRNAILAGTHSIYLADYVLNINSDALTTANRVDSGQAAATSSELVFRQAGSNFNWIPDDDSPLTIGGGVRATDTQRVADTGTGPVISTGLSTASASLQANYPTQQRWVFAGSASGLTSRTSDQANGSTKSFLGIAGLTAEWQGEGLRSRLSEWDYALSYGAGSGANYQFGQDQQGVSFSRKNAALNSSVSQSGTRQFVVEGYKSPLMASLGQGYGLGISGGSGSSVVAGHSLSHNAGLNWAVDAAASTPVALSLSAIDTRSFGPASGSWYQSINGSASANTVLSGQSAASATFSLAFNRQGQRGAASAGWIGSGGGSVGYSHSRFADVRGLSYSANYNLSLRPRLQPDSSAAGGFDLAHQISQQWSWQLGLLAWSVSNSYNLSPEGESNMSLLFTVSRLFGGVL